MIDAQNNRLVRLSGLAHRLGLPIRWLHAETRAGRLPHLNAGGTLLFDPDAVERTLQRRAAEGAVR